MVLASRHPYRQNGPAVSRNGTKVPWQEAIISSVDLLMPQWMKRVSKGDSVDEVSTRMWATDSEEDHYDLAMALQTFLGLAGRDREALQVLDDLCKRYPDNIRPRISKATSYLYFLDDPEEALRAIDVALQMACRNGFFRREALGVKARILVKLGRGEQLCEVLEEIMSLQMTKGVPDVGRERDFVDRAPPGLISEDVLARYNQFRPKRAGDTKVDKPPEWESPGWE